MARKPVFDICMLCGECPCECKRAARKTVPRKVAKKATPPITVVEEVPADVAPVTPLSVTPTDPTPAPRPDPRAAMRAAAGRARPVTPRTPEPAPITHLMSGSTGSPPGDTVMDDAIRALAPLLHPIEKRKHAKVLGANSPHAARAADWRARHGAHAGPP